MSGEIEEMLRTEFIASTMNVTTQTVRNWIAAGQLKAIRINRQWRVPKSSFVAFLDERHGAHGTTTVNAGGQRIGVR